MNNEKRIYLLSGDLIMCDERVGSDSLHTIKLRSGAKVISDIRQVDFKNFTYRSTGEDGQEYSFRLRNGRHAESSGSEENSLTELDRVIYGDLTGDGKAEAIVLLDETVSVSVAEQHIYLYSIERGQVVKLTDFVSGSNNCVLAGEECTVLDVRVRGGLLIIDRAIPANTDAKCCPSRHRLVTYRWNGSRLIEVSKSRIMKRTRV